MITTELINDWASTKMDGSNINPKNAYSSCVYTGQNGEHCIAGQFLIDNGYEVPGWGDGENTQDIQLLLEDYAYSITSDGREFLSAMQDAADSGLKWEDAYRFSKKYIENDDYEAFMADIMENKEDYE